MLQRIELGTYRGYIGIKIVDCIGVIYIYDIGIMDNHMENQIWSWGGQALQAFSPKVRGPM